MKDIIVVILLNNMQGSIHSSDDSDSDLFPTVSQFRILYKYGVQLWRIYISGIIKHEQKYEKYIWW